MGGTVKWAQTKTGREREFRRLIANAFRRAAGMRELK